MKAYEFRSRSTIAYDLAKMPEARIRDVFGDHFAKAQADFYRAQAKVKAAKARYQAAKEAQEKLHPDPHFIVFLAEHLADGVNCFIQRQLDRIWP